MEKNKKEVLAGENTHRLNEISDDKVDLFIREHIENKVVVKSKKERSNQKLEKQVEKEEVDNVADKVKRTQSKIEVVK